MDLQNISLELSMIPINYYSLVLEGLLVYSRAMKWEMLKIYKLIFRALRR